MDGDDDGDGDDDDLYSASKIYVEATLLNALKKRADSIKMNKKYRKDNSRMSFSAQGKRRELMSVLGYHSVSESRKRWILTAFMKARSVQFSFISR